MDQAAHFEFRRHVLGLILTALQSNIITITDLQHLIKLPVTPAGAVVMPETWIASYGPTGSVKAFKKGNILEEHGKRYVGTLKGYSESDAYGFLNCPELRAIYNVDVYIHKNVYMQVTPPLQIGESVNFSIHENSKGQPQACFVRRAAW